MGALAPVSPWIPEDDVLLRNAVEAGASLESLAKGAVQFSRRFSIRELQERWHALLYDPVVSAEAAFHMIQFERSVSTLPSKCNRAGNFKENKCCPAKRKAKSVRSCFCALRKRNCNEPFNSVDLSFLVAPNNSNYIGNESEPLSGDCMLGYPNSTHFELPESDLDLVHHAFSQNGDNHTGEAFHTGYQDIVQEDFQMEHDDAHNEVPHVLGENLMHSRNVSVTEEFGQTEELPLKGEALHGCSDFHGNELLDSQIAGCDPSFHNLECPSPLPEMPIWTTAEGILAPDILVDLVPKEEYLCRGKTCSFPAEDGNTHPVAYEITHGTSNLELEVPSEELKNEAASEEGYLAEISSSLLNDFPNEEDFPFTDGGKDMFGKSYYDGLSSLLLSSPIDANQDQMPTTAEPESPVTLDCAANQSGACPGESDDRGSHRDGNVVFTSEARFLASTSVSNLQCPELRNGVICCLLNTEDPEIPCNDDVVFTKQSRAKAVSSISRRGFLDAAKPNSLHAMANNGKTYEDNPVPMQIVLENPTQSHGSSQMIRSQVIPESGLPQPVGDCRVKFKLRGSDSNHRTISVAYGGGTQINSANLSKGIVMPPKAKEDSTEAALVKHLSHDSAPPLIQNPAFNSEGYKCYSHTNFNDVKQEENAPARVQNQKTSNAKIGSADTVILEQAVNHAEDLLEESDDDENDDNDDDVPYFSDIEAMILDMDLDPEDQDLNSCKEVSRYQHEDTKRAIIRLEQGAYAHMQRTISSHGAFAILYGRHSRHYIKKAEVLIGRATEDVIVDIDLGREGRANKISRRQAIINLDKSGSFHLKNLGKCSISVNDKEIGPGQSVRLSSSCLVEIRGMPFIFETNQTSVKRYLDRITQESQNQECQV